MIGDEFDVRVDYTDRTIRRGRFTSFSVWVTILSDDDSDAALLAAQYVGCLIPDGHMVIGATVTDVRV